MLRRGPTMASSSSSGSSNNYPDSFLGIVPSSGEQFSRLQALIARPMRPTRFCHRETLQHLRLDLGVSRLFDRIGWRFLRSFEFDTYRRITLEFLSSVAMTKKSFSFRLYNNSWEFNFSYLTAEIHYDSISRNHYGSPNYGHIRSCFNHDAAWRRLTRFSTFPEEALSSHIINPCYRLAHQILANSLFARADTSYVTEDELFFLYAMSGDRRWGTPEFPQNTAYWIVRALISESRSFGPICCGGMITLILSHLLPLPGDEPALPGPTLIDNQYLLDTGVFTRFGLERFGYLYGPERSVFAILPHPDGRRILIDYENDIVRWEFFPDPGYGYAINWPVLDPPDWGIVPGHPAYIPPPPPEEVIFWPAPEAPAQPLLHPPSPVRTPSPPRLPFQSSWDDNPYAEDSDSSSS